MWVCVRTSFGTHFVPKEMFYTKLQTFLFSVSPHSAAGVTWLVSLKFSCAMDMEKGLLHNHADSAHLQTWRQYKFSLLPFQLLRLQLLILQLGVFC